MSEPTPVVEARGVTVRYGELVATDYANLRLYGGEVHVVLGENGAGKTSLVKALYGVHEPAAGEILLDGVPTQLPDPATARGHGIGMVFQDLQLVPALTVAENVALALPGRRHASHALRTAVREEGARLRLTVDPDATVRGLSLAEWQQVAILRALMGGARVLILDEPTSALAPPEVDALVDTLEGLRARGLAIALITHKLAEARAIAGRFTVLRTGRTVIDGMRAHEVDDDRLVAAMIGHAVPPATLRARGDAGALVLRVRNVDVASDRGGLALRGVDLDVHEGELVGVAGVAGSGQRELAEAVLGLRRTARGDIRIDGHLVGGDPSAALAAGAVGLPDDPIAEGVVPGLNVLQTLSLGRSLPTRHGSIDWRATRNWALTLPELDRLSVPPLDRDVATLSGGNLKRVFYARAVASPARLLVLANPSRGLDIAAARAGSALVHERCREGCAVLMISEDLDELLAACDRVVILRAAEVAAVLDPAATDRHAIGQLMMGTSA